MISLGKKRTSDWEIHIVAGPKYSYLFHITFFFFDELPLVYYFVSKTMHDGTLQLAGPHAAVSFITFFFILWTRKKEVKFLLEIYRLYLKTQSNVKLRLQVESNL